MSETKKVTAADVLVAVMREVEGVAKREKNQQQGFNFRGIDAVVNAVGPALRKHGGFIVPNLVTASHEVATTAKGSQVNVSRVQVAYSVYGAEGEPITGVVAAEAMDSGDKATAKAMSVAYRTFLLQALCLPTDEPDPDASSYAATGGAAPVAPEWKSRVAAADDLAALSHIHAAAVAEGWVSPELMSALTVRKGQIGKAA